MYYFGYTNVDDNPVSFFNYKEHSEEHLMNFNKFVRDNEANLERVCAPDFKEKSNMYWACKTPSSFIQMGPDFIAKGQIPM